MVMTRRVGALFVIWLTLGLTTPLLAEVPAPAAGRPALTNQRISLDLKGVDILDVLKLFSQKSGLNFVAGRNVSGRVTIFVNDVDVWEAFELIIEANDLAYERRGNIVTVMMARDYELLYGEKFQERNRNLVQPLRHAKAIQVATVLNQIKSSVGRVVADEATNTLILNDVPSRLQEMREILRQIDRPTETHVYTLNYADAKTLQEKVQEMLSPIGSFTFDARTNKAIISDLREVLQKTDQLVRAFDAPDGQVLIEAKIIKVELTDEMDLGIDWQRVFGGVDAAARSNLHVLSDVVGGTATGTALKLITAPSGNGQLIIEALKKLTKTETLSNPRIMVSNNQEAKILVGTREAVVTVTTTVPATGSTVSSPQIQFVDVGTKLYVTPSVKRDGHIQLKIKPEVSTSKVETFEKNRIPIVSSTEAETSVLVKHGVTLIIGGLIETKTDRTENRVPFLGDIPILGLPFRGSTDTKKKTELVVFLTPQIVMPDGSPFVLPQPTESIPGASMPEVILQEPVPAAYRALIRRHLQQSLASRFRSATLRRGSVVVSFVLSHDGRLVGGEDITSPEGEPFIRAARAALKAAQPFPPFPEGSEASEVRFRLALEYVP
ncbi:MAG: TonB C-terminal domain-containing protein [Candidatus Omnitrophica bacterium]|nr:TonB C-terminal domain-containing protein [Candidatus Omnitrophota bacterium]